MNKNVIKHFIFMHDASFDQHVFFYDYMLFYHTQRLWGPQSMAWGKYSRLVSRRSKINISEVCFLS